MNEKKTLPLGADDIEQAATLLRAGGLVAVPTETVYGLAVDCRQEAAVQAIYRAKGRAESKPLSVLLSGMSMVETVCQNIPPAAFALARAFWPGPLTMILPDGGVVADSVRAGGASLGVRCPDHPATLAVIRALAAPLAAPSANLSGEESPKCAADVWRQLDGRIDAVLDGGSCALSLESTIIDLTGEFPRILRQGVLPAAEIWRILEGVGSMKIIGITGGTGAGKTTALNALRQLDALVIDADAVYHALTERSVELRRDLEGRFGSVYDGAGRLERKKLGNIVFNDPKALEELNGLTHRYVGVEVDRLIAQAEREGRRAVAIDAIELVNSGLGDRCHAKVAITAPKQLRIARIMAREGIGEDYARLRVEAQRDETYFKQHCEHVLENGQEDTVESFEQKALMLFRSILTK